MQAPSPQASTAPKGNGTAPNAPEQMPQQQPQGDQFLALIQGPVIHVTVGTGATLQRYNLPINLLSTNSLFFRDEIALLRDAAAATSASKKRKVASDADVTIGGHVIEEEEGKDTSTAPMALTVPDLDPHLFGLFLKYIYRSGNEASPPRMPSSINPLPRMSTFAPPAAGRPAAPQAPVGGGNASRHQPPPPPKHAQRASNQRTVDPNARFQNPPPAHAAAPQAPPVITQDANYLPCCIDAWIVAQDLGSYGYMNSAMSQILQEIGSAFTLTPAIVAHVWKHTMPASAASGGVDKTSNDNNDSGEHDTTSETNSKKHTRTAEQSTKPSPKPCAALTPSPLRTFILHVLVMYWAKPCPHIIAKAYGPAWNLVFDTYADLRRDFISGLQMGLQVQPFARYYVSSPPVHVQKSKANMGGDVKVKVEDEEGDVKGEMEEE